MSNILESQKIKSVTEPVFVANHYHAIADIVMLQLLKNKIPSIATNRTINQWLDTKNQVVTLIQKYLCPLAIQLRGDSLIIYQQWMKTLRYE